MNSDADCGTSASVNIDDVRKDAIQRGKVKIDKNWASIETDIGIAR